MRPCPPPLSAEQILVPTASISHSRLRSEVRDKDAITQRLMSQHSHMQEGRDVTGGKGDHVARMSAELGWKNGKPSTAHATKAQHAAVNIVFLPPHLHPSRPLWR